MNDRSQLLVVVSLVSLSCLAGSYVGTLMGYHDAHRALHDRIRVLELEREQSSQPTPDTDRMYGQNPHPPNGAQPTGEIR